MLNAIAIALQVAANGLQLTGIGLLRNLQKVFHSFRCDGGLEHPLTELLQMFQEVQICKFEEVDNSLDGLAVRNAR